MTPGSQLGSSPAPTANAPSVANEDVIVIPAHNRKAVTLEALGALAAQGILSWATVLVVDDGSADGTSDAIRDLYPAVFLLRGDGTWWWCGSIRRGMDWALVRGAKRILWLNDDCRPPAGALLALSERVRREDCVGWINAETPGGWSYGGHRKTLWGVRRGTPGEEQAGRIDTFSGNCVCLSRRWIERAGLPDDHLFPHGLGDLDYGLRLRDAGAALEPIPGIAAVNADPSAASSESWLASTRPMPAIWGDFSSPRSFLYFPAWRRFALRHWGPIWGWFVFAAPYARWVGIAVIRGATPGLAKSIASRRKHRGS
jgi:glycosyltransferase involved in cell wall biosynthesis